MVILKKKSLFWIRKFIFKEVKSSLQKRKTKRGEKFNGILEKLFFFQKTNMPWFSWEKKFNEKTTDFMNIFQKNISWVFEKYSLNEKALWVSGKRINICKVTSNFGIWNFRLGLIWNYFEICMLQSYICLKNNWHFSITYTTLSCFLFFNCFY